MSVLSREDFLNRLQERLGEDTSDESIAFLDDMVDTYNDLEQRAMGDGEDWEKKYHDLDESWKKKYRSRFFSGAAVNPSAEGAAGEDEGGENPDVMVEDLFEEKGDK